MDPSLYTVPVSTVLMIDHSMIAASLAASGPRRAKSSANVCWQTSKNCASKALALGSALDCKMTCTLKKCGRRSNEEMTAFIFARIWCSDNSSPDLAYAGAAQSSSTAA